MFLQRVIAYLYSRRQWLATAAVALFAGGLCYKVVFGANGMMAYRQKLQEYRQLQRQVQQSQDENEKLQQRIKQLKSDPQAIEKEAREQFRYARPGETIYVFPAPKPQPSTSTSTAQKR